MIVDLRAPQLRVNDVIRLSARLRGKVKEITVGASGTVYIKVLFDNVLTPWMIYPRDTVVQVYRD